MKRLLIAGILLFSHLGYNQSTVSIYELDEPPIAPGCEEMVSGIQKENCTLEYLQGFIQEKLDSLAKQQIVAVDGVEKVSFWINFDSEGKVTHLTYRSGSTPQTKEDLYAELQKLPDFEPGKMDEKPQGVRLIVDYIPINRRQ